MTPKKNDTLKPKEATVPQAETPREKFERERMNRRAALAKIGLRAGATAFALFAVEDVARLVIGRMVENKEMRQVADSLGREFKNAGVAFADDEDLTTCAHCCNQYCRDIAVCVQSNDKCVRCNKRADADCSAEATTCFNNALYSFNQCESAHCSSTDTCPPCPPIAEIPCHSVGHP